jgi:hypothetical protein
MAGSWPGLGSPALADLAVATDYRQVLAKLLTGHTGCADAATVIPRIAISPNGLWC